MLQSCSDTYNCKPPPFPERISQKSPPKVEEQDLRKCLNLFDLTIQGMAHTLGVGIFTMTPGVIQMEAGPGLVVSYLIATTALSITVLSYMDLGARYRGIGNAYVYVYNALGEFAAAIVGTFALAEISLSFAFYAVGFGENLDKFILNGSASRLEFKYASAFLPLYIADNVNLMAIALIVVCCIINIIGIKQVAITNTLTVAFSVLTILMYCIISLIYGNSRTFLDSVDPVSHRGGVFPFGASGVITGAGMVVVSYSGFESVVSLSAEAKNSKRDVPIAVALAFSLSTVIYISFTAAIAYLVPWYTLTASTGVPGSLAAHGLKIPMYISIAAILCASASIALTSLTTLTRGLLVYSEDGLIFSFLSSVNDCTKVPIAATVSASVVTIIFTLAFPYDILIHLVSGGTLLTFMAVCYSIIVIAYTKVEKEVDECTALVHNEVGVDIDQKSSTSEKSVSCYVENQEWKIVGLMAIFSVLAVISGILFYYFHFVPLWSIRVPIMVVLGIICLLIVCYINHMYHVQPQSDPGFVCPGVPFVPAIGIITNLFLFGALDKAAHIMTLAYIGFGALVYFGYGYFHSTITLNKRKQLELVEISGDENECETEKEK